jgi:hypothetical protein
MKVDVITVCLGNWGLCVFMYVVWSHTSVMVREVQMQASLSQPIKTKFTCEHLRLYLLQSLLLKWYNITDISEEFASLFFGLEATLVVV